MTTLLSIALRRAAEMQGRRVRNVVIPAAEPVRPGVGRRAAADAPLNLRPISISRPAAETAQSLREGVLDCFTRPARRLAR
jgi:hypothetical protein